MNKFIREFARIVSISFTIREPIYEFGSFLVPGQETVGNLRSLFPQKEFVGCDIRHGPGVDKILNLHNIDAPAESVGTVICLNTLEHVEYPFAALGEIHRILKPDGMAIISAPMNFAIHDYPSDYWRFTPEGFKSLLQPFPSSFVGFTGVPIFPDYVVGIGFKGEMPPLQMFEAHYHAWKIKPPFKEALRKFIPPILIPYIKSLLSRG